MQKKCITASHFQGGVAETEMLRLVKERDELKAALLDFEKHMEDIQKDVKALSTERDHFKTLSKQVSFRNITPPGGNYLSYAFKDQMFLFSQAQEDLKLTRTDMSADLLKLKEEIKLAEVKIQQTSAERDTLMERLKVSPAFHGVHDFCALLWSFTEISWLVSSKIINSQLLVFVSVLTVLTS